MTADGRRARYVTRRFLPASTALGAAAEVLVTDGDRLDLIASRTLGDPEQYWRIGDYLVEDRTIEEVEKDVFIPFIHRPLSRYVNAMAAAGLVLRHMNEPAPPPGLPPRGPSRALQRAARPGR